MCSNIIPCGVLSLSLTVTPMNLITKLKADGLYGARLGQKFTLEGGNRFYAFAPLEALACV
jgi:hypothetical protein